jgi:Spy/CpxP family protein refolding chaperone
MNRSWCCLAALVFVPAVASAQAQDKAPQPYRPFSPPGSGAFGAVRPLLLPGMAERLGLSAKQKEEIEKLQKGISDKQKEMAEKMRAAFEKGRKDGDKDAAAKAQEQVKEMLKAMQKEHEEAEAKLKDILTEEQYKKYEQIKKQAPFALPGGRPGGSFIPMPGFRMFPGLIVPPPVQEMLRLTPEQREKIQRIQKEAEEKILEVLTEEQRKKIEESRRNLPGALPAQPPPADRK